MSRNDIAFEMAVSSVRYGVGVTREVGMDLADMGATLVMVVTDPVVARLAPSRTVLESLDEHKVPYVLYDRVRVEPSDESFLDAIAFGLRRRRRRIDDRHREGGEPLHDLSAGRFSRLREPADRQRAAGPRPAQAADGDSDHRRHRQ
jgi:hypothetical protein